VRVVKNHHIDLLSSPRHSGYAGNAMRVLAALSVSIVMLPGLAEGEDIEQWIAGRRALGIAKTAILAELRLLVSACA
jgi:hypothetical protein